MFNTGEDIANLELDFLPNAGHEITLWENGTPLSPSYTVVRVHHFLSVSGIAHGSDDTQILVTPIVEPVEKPQDKDGPWNLRDTL